jgi:hypothetical protein
MLTLIRGHTKIKGNRRELRHFCRGQPMKGRGKLLSSNVCTPFPSSRRSHPTTFEAGSGAASFRRELLLIAVRFTRVAEGGTPVMEPAIAKAMGACAPENGKSLRVPPASTIGHLCVPKQKTDGPVRPLRRIS